MSNGVKLIFEKTYGIDKFLRIDNTHPINIYIGKDASYRNTMFIFSPFKPIPLKSSELIDVIIGIRKDNMWGISLSLKDINFIDLFCHFCDDIIQSSCHITDIKKGIIFICERYEQWQKMLKKDMRGLLSKNEIKGIIGELLFLKNYMIPTFGETVALDSWLGPDKLPQDFVCDNKWYEIKSVSSNSDKVSISSISQLDSEFGGELIVINLDNTSNIYSAKIIINEYYNTLLEALVEEENKSKLKSNLFKLGYFPREEYNEYIFKFSKCYSYKVTDSFPCLRKKKIPKSVLEAKYELSLISISEFLTEVYETWK